MKAYGFNEHGRRFIILGSLKRAVVDLAKSGRSSRAFILIICSLYRTGGVTPDGVYGDSVRELIIEL
jgi:hypothetical protein